MFGKLFVNYRRDDAAASAARLRDRLVTAFGAGYVFMDVDNLLVGQRFDRELDKVLAEADVFLAVIGPKWMDLLRDRTGGDERDYVREEIASALKRGVMVIPVLVERAKLPRAADLPEEIRELVLHQKHDISHETFGRDVESLVAGIKAAREAARANAPQQRARRRGILVGVSVITLAAFISLLYFTRPTTNVQPPTLPPSGDLARSLQEQKRLDDLDQELRREREARTAAEATQSKRELEARQKTEADAIARAKEGERQRLAEAAAEASRKAEEVAHANDPAFSITPGSGQSFQDKRADGSPCPTCPRMVVLPAGSFLMGLPESVQAVKSDPDDRPQHRVTIDKVAVGEFSVTVDEFGAFVKATGYEASDCEMLSNGVKLFMRGRGTWRSPGFPQTGTHPAVCLNWNDAKAYTAWLSKVTGKTYRLLTESEWEYAARAGSTTRYFFGDDDKDICNYANVKDLSAITQGNEYTAAPCNDGFPYTAPSGSFKPNAFGLYDMIGNASQWVEDCKSGNYSGVPDDGSAVEFPTCELRSQRGGSWQGSHWNVWVSNREAQKPGVRFNIYGFRVARELGVKLPKRTIPTLHL